MDRTEIIERVQQGKCSESELLEYLKMHYLYVSSNAMREVARHGYNSAEIVVQLKNLCQYRDSTKHKLFGIDTVGLLAIATLIKVGIKKEDIKCYAELDDLFKARVDVLVQEAFEDMDLR